MEKTENCKKDTKETENQENMETSISLRTSENSLNTPIWRMTVKDIVKE